MTKEEAKQELEAIKLVYEIFKKSVNESDKRIAELEAIINKKDDWRDKLVNPVTDKHFYISVDITSRYGVDWLKPMAGCNRNAALLFKEKSHAKIVANKIQLMQEMHAFAHARNEGWIANWGGGSEKKFGVLYNVCKGFEVSSSKVCNFFVFGIAVESKEIAQEMLEEFGERIEEIYNNQY